MSAAVAASTTTTPLCGWTIVQVVLLDNRKPKPYEAQKRPNHEVRSYRFHASQLDSASHVKGVTLRQLLLGWRDRGRDPSHEQVVELFGNPSRPLECLPMQSVDISATALCRFLDAGYELISLEVPRERVGRGADFE